MLLERKCYVFECAVNVLTCFSVHDALKLQLVILHPVSPRLAPTSGKYARSFAPTQILRTFKFFLEEAAPAGGGRRQLLRGAPGGGCREGTRGARARTPRTKN